MKTKWLKKSCLLVLFLFVFQQSIFAFSDIEGNKAEKDILELKERGIVKGVTSELFDPQGNITYASAVTLIVRALDLNIDHIRLIKEPKASDYYERVKDDKWYATPFIYAQYNGIELPTDVNPDEVITKEKFAHMLFTALTTKHELAFIHLWINIEDENEITPEYMNSIQKLTISQITELEDGKFLPKHKISRSEAAVILLKTMLFVESVVGTN